MRLALAALTLAAACSAVVPETAARLSATDPLSADPAGLAVALSLPEGLAPGPEPATLVLTLTTQADEERLVLPLRALDAPNLAGAEGAVLALALTAEGAAEMRALQARARASEHGSLTVGIGIPGCRIGPGPATDARGAAWLRLSADEPFRPLIRPMPLAELLGPQAWAGLRPCPATGAPQR